MIEMKKRNIVKENRDFNRIISLKQFIKDQNFVVYYQPNNENKNRFGISVGTKVGNAVIRNKLKRQVRNILDIDKKLYSNGMDYIIIVRKNCLDISFQEMQKSLIDLMKKLNKRRTNENEEK